MDDVCDVNAGSGYVGALVCVCVCVQDEHSVDLNTLVQRLESNIDTVSHLQLSLH